MVAAVVIAAGSARPLSTVGVIDHVVLPAIAVLIVEEPLPGGDSHDARGG
jgi:hypothetical protein